ncbi:MAG: T6SS immunity protein Tli4 family protein [Duganella sp.]
MTRTVRASHIAGLSACACVALFCFEKFDFGGGRMDESPRILKIFEHTRTVCVGRFLIDVPDEAQIVYGPVEVPYPVVVYRGKADEMEKIIAARLVEIEVDKPHVYDALAAPDSMLGKVLDGALPGHKILFGISRASFAFYGLGSYVRVGDDLFIQEAEAMGAAQQYQKIVQELNAMAPLFASRRDDHIPSEAGLCIENGFIKYAARSMYESVSVGMRLSSFPDVHLSISATNKDIAVPSDALEPRVRQGEQLLKSEGQGAWYSQVKKLREGPRQIGNWSGYEFLARMPSQERTGESHEFSFLSQGEPNNPYLPVLDIELQSGVRDNKIGATRPGVTDQEAVMIWDRLTSSIRVRPHQ